MTANAPDKPGRSPRPGLLRRLRRGCLLVLASYLGAVVLIAALQRHLIYFPSRQYAQSPADVGLPYEKVQLETEDRVRLAAWYVSHEDPIGHLIFFHGNAGNISGRLHDLVLLHRMQLAVLIIDYRGFGESEGVPGEKGTYRDADAAWHFLTETRGVPADRIVLFGRSLGGAIAIDLATRTTPAAMVVESTFTSLADIGKLHYPFIPVRLILRHRYESIRKVPGIRCPKFFAHGADDSLIPLANGQALFTAAAEPKQWMETPGEHNDSGYAFSPDFTDRLEAWLRAQLEPAKKKSPVESSTGP